MKNPTLLKENITLDEAEELMDYLYCERIDFISRYDKDIMGNNSVSWFSNGEHVAKWTETFKNLMISKDFLENK